MAEFVEEGIEGLLPAFEALRDVQLLSPAELELLPKRCVAYEYRIQRGNKDVESFRAYVEYLKVLIKLIRLRRKRMKFQRTKENEIEGVLKTKIVSLYRQCCERFQASLFGFSFQLRVNGFVD
ncbi:unnamed protein product [Gongylonema pulchrum]|uniref:V-type proton ATPase subunit a n=1 Tax=Gongylonema pulchrum TaxID=637853 RepID=A0A183EQQ6_9BILA|nr:unnamed protein product [Gongylonema pulchrum]